MKRLWLPALLLAIAAVLLTGCQKRGRLEIGDEVPPITLSDLNGQTVTLPSDYNGKVILVRFWSVDCGFCDKKMLLMLEQFKQRYQERKFIPIAINEGRLAKDNERLKSLGQLSYPILVDEYGSVAKHFGVIGLPTTFVIDEDGILRDKLTGEASVEEYEKLLTTILNKGVFYESGH